MAATELHCPSCGLAHPRDERFCRTCGMPLVRSAGVQEDPGPARRRARQIEPRYTEGPLVKVATAANQPEAELIEMMLLAEGIPSMQRRSGAFDVPDFLAAGLRDILVPQSAQQAAREALTPAEDL